MIVIFPMLTDESVSQNALPGICKALEKFVILYELDSITKITGEKILKIGGQLANAGMSAAGRLMKTKNESENLVEKKFILLNEYEPSDAEREYARARTKKIPGKESDTEEITSNYVKNTLSTLKGIRDIGTVKIETPTDNNLSLEPTWMLVETTTGSKLIGIKVIPVPVKSKEGYSLAELLTVDASMNFFNVLGLKIYRKVIRSFWALCRGLRHIPVVSFLTSPIWDRVITGNPERDILWAWTFHKRYIFCLLNYADITDSQFFKNAGGIHKLHDLGWNSFIAMDDVNKRVIFCMKQFHGLCSSVSYSFVYSSLGKEHAKVYDNLEDIKKSASPFFKTSVSVKRLVGESKQTITNYLKRIS